MIMCPFDEAIESHYLIFSVSLSAFMQKRDKANENVMQKECTIYNVTLAIHKSE